MELPCSKAINLIEEFVDGQARKRRPHTHQDNEIEKYDS
jgi:hypothetical protein